MQILSFTVQTNLSISVSTFFRSSWKAPKAFVFFMIVIVEFYKFTG